MRFWMVNVPVLSPGVKLMEPGHVTAFGLPSACVEPPSHVRLRLP
jgi:hypothetical protein